MASSQTPTVAFFGATGGVASAALASSLSAGFKVTALVRTPQKLRDLLLTLSVSESIMDANLTTIKGSVQDVPAVKEALAPSNNPVSLVIFGVGGSPKLTANPLRPVTLDNVHICEEGVTAIFAAMRELTSAGVAIKPTMLAVSTTGISERNDVPCAYLPFYHYVLAVPHKDKKVMEDMLIEATATGLLENFVILRPTLLSSGKPKGLENVKVGWDLPEGAAGAEGAPGPAVGYTISKADVGQWIFENVVAAKDDQWKGKLISLTY